MDVPLTAGVGRTLRYRHSVAGGSSWVTGRACGGDVMGLDPDRGMRPGAVLPRFGTDGVRAGVTLSEAKGACL